MRARVSWRLGPPLLAFAVGTLAAFHPTLFSGLGRVQGGLGDTRFVNYCLEHTYRWALRAPGHEDLWSPPAFYPHRNTYAYSDLLLGVAPLYWVWRAVGLEYDTAYQLFMLSVTTLNFLASYVFFRRCFAFSVAASAAGAYLFAYGSPRMANLVHQQLVPQFFVLLALFALHQLCALGGDESIPRRRVAGWIGVFFLAMVLQAWSAVYPAFFLGLGLTFALVLAPFFDAFRARLWTTCRRHALAIAAALAVALLLLAPLARHYRLVVEESGAWGYERVSQRLLDPRSLVSLGVSSWLYGSVVDLQSHLKLTQGPGNSNGLGVATSLAALCGLALGWRRPGVRLTALVCLALILLASRYPGDRSPWALVYFWFPGASAIRAVSRIGQVLVLAGSIGVAVLAERLLEARMTAIAALLAAICAAEQIHLPRTYDKREVRARVERVAARVAPACRAFYVTSSDPEAREAEVALYAEWASLAASVPTIDGYSGQAPPRYGITTVIANAREESVLEQAVGQWLEMNGLPPGEVCRIRLESVP